MNDFIRRPLQRVNPAEVSKVVDPETGEPQVVYHGGRSTFSAIKRGFGNFLGGLFVREGKPSGYGEKQFELFLRGEVLELDVLSDLLETEEGQKVLSEMLPNDVDEDVLSEVAEALTDWSHYPDSEVVWDAIGAVDEADSAVEIQVLRGRLAQAFGYPSVRTPDEFDGDTIMVMEPAAIKSATGNIGTFDEGFDEIMFSRKAQTKAAYEARIDALFAGAKPQQPGVKMLDEADTLTITGYENLPVMLMERHAVVRGSEVHPLTAEQWKQVPDWIDNPAAMFERQRDGHITLIGPEKIGGKAVVIALEPQMKPAGGRGPSVNHLMLTAYAKDTGTMPLRAMVERGDMKPLYIDQKKASSFYAGSGVQFPGSGVELRGFNRSLKTERDLVKYRAERDEAMFSRREENIRKAKGKANAKREEVRQTLDAAAQTPGWNYSSAQWEGLRGQLSRQRADLQDKMLAWRDAQGQIEQQMGQAVCKTTSTIVFRYGQVGWG